MGGYLLRKFSESMICVLFCIRVTYFNKKNKALQKTTLARQEIKRGAKREEEKRKQGKIVKQEKFTKT